MVRSTSMAVLASCGGVAAFVSPLSSPAPRWQSAASTFIGNKAAAAQSIWQLHPSRLEMSTVERPLNGERKRVVVIGNGMVGHRLIEKLNELDQGKNFEVATFCEERRSAYNRMRLTEYFTKRDVNDLSMAGAYNEAGTTEWYKENGVHVYLNDKATEIDREKKVIRSAQGREVPYDVAVLATGSFPFVPPTPGIKRPGVFVYRTIDDLEAMIAYQKEHGVTAAAVIGGGLLGLEAAKAMNDLGMKTHIVEYAPILMCRQIDQDGHNILGGMIEGMGLKIHCDARVTAVTGEGEDGRVTGLAFSNEGWEPLDVGMVVVSAGIRPRDEVARVSGINVHERGGVIVDDLLRTSDPNVYAIGEVALHGGKIYGLVAPGYQMADAVAKNLAAGSAAGLNGDAAAATAEESPEQQQLSEFKGADMSTKLKLMGVDVASFGSYTLTGPEVQPLAWNDPFSGVYRKLVFRKDGKRLLGGILVGDASDYSSLLALTKIDADLPMSPQDLLLPAGATAGSGSGAATVGVESMPDEMQVCSCNDVTKGAIVGSVSSGECKTVADVKRCTKAGTGCGGCEPQIKTLLAHTLASMGQTVTNHVCEHFHFSRQELYDLIRVNEYKSFDEVLAAHGHGDGCETCKPAIASILATLWNDHVLSSDRLSLQDTNDRALANMQRGGSYSVVPRMAGGEVTPEGLIAIGKVAADYGLYTKVTGGQRIDLFGAEKHQLPYIWEKLGEAGFESGHAYGKSLRTVKSCVGSTWCRYGMRDAVGFAIEVENRYKGLRAPHKLKSAVSGCIRECAEAQCKDFGMIATETGYNLYVCGNGGAQPKHGELLASGIDEETVIRYLDRFLMYYVATADRLERTARWFEKLDGGIEYLKDVIIHDKLGLAETLEQRMQAIVDTYQDEWATAVADPVLRASFKQFVNTDETERGIAFVPQRGMARPMDWPKDEDIPKLDARKEAEEKGVGASGNKQWMRVGAVADFPRNGGATVKYGKSQLAVYRLERRASGGEGEWYASQNVCPHKRALVLSQGLVGDRAGEPKVACPLHKKNFSLKSGNCLDEPELSLLTFPVEVRDGGVYLFLPPASELDAVLATEKVAIGGSDCSGGCPSVSLPGQAATTLNSFVPFGTSGSAFSSSAFSPKVGAFSMKADEP